MGLFKKLSAQLYFTIDKGYITVQQIGTEEKIETKTDVIIDAKTYTTISIGKDVTPLNNESVNNGFNHDRMVIGDFVAAISCIDYIIKKFIQNPFIRPIAIIKNKRKFEGGLTLVERKVIIDTFESAGARKVFLWDGDDFSATQLQDWRVIKNLFETYPELVLY